MTSHIAGRLQQFKRIQFPATLLVLALLLSAGATPSWAGRWQIECVDCPKYVGSLTDRSLRLDAEGWHEEELVDGKGHFTSLALAQDGYLHISYYCVNLSEPADLKYAKKDAAGWHIELLDSEEEVGSYTSIAL